MKVVNKEEFVRRLAEEAGMTIKDADRAVRAFCKVVKRSLAADEEIVIRGFGTFLMKERAARVARNPKTGKEIVIPKRKVPFFKPGANLKSIVVVLEEKTKKAGGKKRK